MENPPTPTNPHQNPEYVKDIVMDLILTIITLGLFNLFVQYRQCEAVNNMIGEQKYSFIKWLLLSFITCGLYHIYHEYIKSEDIARAVGRDPGQDGLINLLLSIFGLSIVADAIQQSHINKFYGGD